MERRLGRGLGSLLGQSDAEETHKQAHELPIDRIRPNRFQPRREFDQVSLADLAKSLKTHGVLQPLVVRDSPPGYELISGERRWRAAALAGLTRVPVVVRAEVSDQDMLELALVENVQREDLNAIERARGFRALMEAVGTTQEGVAEKVGLQRATVANHLRLLELPEVVQAAVSRGLLTMGHARAILAFSTPAEQVRVMERAVRENLSVRALEDLGSQRTASRIAGEKRDGKTLIPHQPWVAEIESRLREALGTRVAVQNSRGYRGRIVIDYFDRATLDRLVRLLAPRESLD